MDDPAMIVEVLESIDQTLWIMLIAVGLITGIVFAK